MVQEIAAEIKPLFSWPWFAGHCQSQLVERGVVLDCSQDWKHVSRVPDCANILPAATRVPPVPHSRAGFLADIRGMTATLSSDTQPEIFLTLSAMAVRIVQFVIFSGGVELQTKKPVFEPQVPAAGVMIFVTF